MWLRTLPLTTTYTQLFPDVVPMIRSIQIQNTSTNSILMRQISNTNNTVTIPAAQTYNYPRAIANDLQAATDAGTASPWTFAGAPEGRE
jgi:hypothetical protein